MMWVEPVVDRVNQTVSYRLRKGGQPPTGTLARAAATCVATGTPIPRADIKREGQAGKLGTNLIAVVAEGRRGRAYIPSVPVPNVDRPRMTCLREGCQPILNTWVLHCME